MTNPSTTDLSSKAKTLLELHKPGDPVILPTVWDAWSANLAVSAGFTALTVGGSVVTLTGRSFDPVELLDAVERKRVNSTAIVGDAFARPLLAALDAEPARWDISSLKVVVSSGVMWSQATKDCLLRHNPRMLLVDALGSSEAIGMASSVSTGTGGGSASIVTIIPQ